MKLSFPLCILHSPIQPFFHTYNALNDTKTADNKSIYNKSHPQTGRSSDKEITVQLKSIVTCLQVILTQTCHGSGYPRQVIKVETLLRRLRFIWTALPTAITHITIIPLGTYNTSSWYIFLRDNATPLVFSDDYCLLESSILTDSS
jgi:hypothetical protein